MSSHPIHRQIALAMALQMMPTQIDHSKPKKTPLLGGNQGRNAAKRARKKASESYGKGPAKTPKGLRGKTQ